MTTTVAALPSPVRPSSHLAGRADLIITAFAPAAWGTTYIVTTELLPPDRPMLTAVLRALPAGLALAALTRRRPTGSWWWKAAVLGALNIGAFFALLFVAAYRLPGGVAATLGSIQPLVAAGLAAVLLKERFRPATAVAGTLGIVGVALLVLRSNATLDPIGVVAGLTGAASMATGVVLTKRWGRPVSLPAFTSWQLIAGGLLLIPIAAITEGGLPTFTTANYLGYTWLATGGTAVAYLAWFRGIARLPVAQVSLLGLASPTVATFAGFALLGQTLSPAQLAGAGLVLAAIWIGQRPDPNDPAATPAHSDPTTSPAAAAATLGCCR
jgi:probable blue pigment (indigoidine) exporter